MTIQTSIKALRQYQQVDVQSGTAFASPHRLILMLMDGALESLSRAKGHLQRSEIAAKGDQISRAISIIGGLREGLNLEVGELAVNLDSIYDYLQRRLIEANLHNDLDLINEVAHLLTELKTAWDEIDPQKAVATPNGAADEISSSA